MCNIIYSVSFLFIVLNFLSSQVSSAPGQITLKDVINLTVQNSGEIKEISMNTARAENNLDKAKGLSRPQLELKLFAAPVYETTGTFESYDNNYSKWGVFTGGEINLIKPLYAWGLKRNLISSAKSGLKVAKLNSTQKRNEILKQVISIYYSHQLARKMLDLVKSNMKHLEKAEKALKKHGDSRKLIKFWLKKNMIEEKKMEASLALTLTGKALSFYTGISEPDIAADLKPFSFLSEDFNFYKNMARDNNFDLRKLNEGLIAKNDQLKAEK